MKPIRMVALMLAVAGVACSSAPALVRRLAGEFDDAQIARILNKQGRRRRSALAPPFHTIRTR